MKKLKISETLIFALSNNDESLISSRIIKDFHLNSTFILYGRISDFDIQFQNLINKAFSGKYKKIIGLGEWSGSIDQIRVELKCRNKFRNTPIGDEVEYFLPSYLKTLNNLPSNFKLTMGGMGNSWCNLISYRICRELTTNSSQVYFDFLHIPSKMQKETALSAVSSIVNV